MSHSHDSNKSCCCHCHEEKHEHEHKHEHQHEHNEEAGFIAEIISATILIADIIIEHTCGCSQLLSIIIFLVAAIPVAFPIVKEMFELWLKHDFMNEFTLMVAAAVGAFIIGEYPEAVAVILFYSFGEKLEEKASDEVKQRIKALLGKLPEHATIKENDSFKQVNPKELEPGTVIYVKPGERVPIDATLLGNVDVDFDTSAITGESVPRSYKPGEEISSGMIPIDKPIELTTIRKFSDSSMSRILQMIESAQESKSPTENMLRRITRWYTPLVFALAILLFCIPALLGALSSFDFVWNDWLRRSLIFLVCSCPCALVVSIPLSYFVSLGSASRKGLLFKGAKYVDAMRDVDTFVFDKTGTLTTGQFHISEIVTANGVSSDKVIEFAAALDAQSAHPFAKAIISYANENNIEFSNATESTVIPHGVKGIIDGKNAIMGSAHLLEREGIVVPQNTLSGSLTCIAVDGKYWGAIALEDTVKSEANSAIDRLHKMGVNDVEILSGDNQNAVKRVADILGADNFHAGLLPDDKLKAIDRLKQEGRKVAFVGDGINDAPAIASANVGIAMGTLGTDIAMVSSDVVIAGDNLEKLPDAIALARMVRHVIAENVSFAIGIKALIMLLGAFGIASLWAAVFADTGVTLITITWAILRLRNRD